MIYSQLILYIIYILYDIVSSLELVWIPAPIHVAEKKREEPVRQETRARQIVRTYHSMHSIRRPKNAKGKLPWLAGRPISWPSSSIFKLFSSYFPAIFNHLRAVLNVLRLFPSRFYTFPKP